jgi:putative DNA primase/helicase
LFGPPNTGKSVFENLIACFLGSDNISSTTLLDISRDKHALIDFHGKLANVTSELSKEVINDTGPIKRLISNTDRIHVRDLYKSWIDFINFAKIVFGTNILPPIGEDIAAFAKRVDMAIFDHVYTKEEYDQNFLDSLTTPQELSGLFNKVIKLLPDLIKRNAFTNQLTIAEATKLYAERSIPEEHFLNEYLCEKPDSDIAKKELYPYYVKYCSKMKLTPISINRFGSYIKKNINWLDKNDKQDMKATVRFGDMVYAVWPRTFFDIAKFNKWLESQD